MVYCMQNNEYTVSNKYISLANIQLLFPQYNSIQYMQLIFIIHITTIFTPIRKKLVKQMPISNLLYFSLHQT